MKKRSSTATRFALRGVALAASCLWASPVLALGLGRLNVQSALGETLKAEIEVTSISSEEAATLTLRVASPEAYRAAGVDYNSVLASSHVQLVKLPDGRTVLRVNSDRAVLEPFVDVLIEANWSSGRLMREYTMLFDPPSSRAVQAAAPAVSAVAGESPAPAASAPAAPPVGMKAPSAAPPAMASTPAQAAPAAGTSRATEVRVRSGDSLSGIAGRVQAPGVSLDQMLVSLFRGNPTAFVGDNMNRLKAGVLLAVPSAEEAGRLAPKDAHDIIQAQSADFAAYRQRLASSSTGVAQEAPARQAAGQVQAQVEDRKQATATTPDRLRLTQGGVKASAPEANVSKATERKDTQARLAELSRNVEALKKLQSAAAPAAVPAPTPPQAPAMAPPAQAAPASAANPLRPEIVAATPAILPSAASAGAAPSASAASAAARRRMLPPPPPAPEPGLLEGLFGGVLDNPLTLAGVGVLVALLAGLGLYKLRGRMRRPAGETSFLESRLQPDSFFGASGGQRIDTREPANSTNSSSSMSYSLSQLDAIGDVDPVAEADVYLAYGRDLQAEEILKEAMRATPERMAIRSKLLEVYAKRRDTKAFELLATQLFNLTRGDGEDWSKAQTLGLSIDPDNRLYQPGGRPDQVLGAAGQVVEPLGASTLPHTAPAAPPAFKPASDATLDGARGGLDLDLEFDAPAPSRPPAVANDATQPFTTSAQSRSGDSLRMNLDESIPKTVPAKRGQSQADDGGGLDFDFGDLNAEPPTVSTRAASSMSDASLDFGDFSLGGEAEAEASDAEAAQAPLARKLELAEEFRQIGDLEGARDLLEEVVAKGQGALKNKAQGMLDKLA